MLYCHTIERIVAVETTTCFITGFVMFETIAPSVLTTRLAFAVVFFFQVISYALSKGGAA